MSKFFRGNSSESDEGSVSNSDSEEDVVPTKNVAGGDRFKNAFDSDSGI